MQTNVFPFRDKSTWQERISLRLKDMVASKLELLLVVVLCRCCWFRWCCRFADVDVSRHAVVACANDTSLRVAGLRVVFCVEFAQPCNTNIWRHLQNEKQNRTYIWIPSASRSVLVLISVWVPEGIIWMRRSDGVHWVIYNSQVDASTAQHCVLCENKRRLLLTSQCQTNRNTKSREFFNKMQ